MIIYDAKNPSRRRDLPFLFRLLHLLQPSQGLQGYSLVELLIAASLIGLVVSISGFAMMTTLKTNQKSQANSTISYNVNRAAEFIQGEIRMAKTLEADSATAVSSITDFTLPSQATPVLVLKTAEGDSIVYYIQPTPSPWLGPYALYRWGYLLDAEGRYDKTQPPSHELLIDSLESRLITSNCVSGWQSTTPSSATRKGFFACVRDNRLVEFSLNATIQPIGGETLEYGTKTSSYIRSN